MADFKLFLPVFFLLSLSFVSAYGDTSSLTVVSGKSYQINYDAKFVQILSALPYTDDQALIISIQVSNPIATLELTIPRELIDSTKNDGTDESFIVLVDGSFKSYVEKNSDKTSRTILIQLAIEDKEIEIIGTHLASSGNNNPTPTPVPTPTKVPTSQPTNQTSTPQQKPTETPSEKPPINTPQQSTDAQQILSKIFQLNLSNLSLNVTGGQIIAYSVILSVILILIVVIASSKKSKTRKQMRK